MENLLPISLIGNISIGVCINVSNYGSEGIAMPRW
jgi:hypothetical protein